MSRLNFQLEKNASGSRARAGRFRTLHNEVLTPLFMPVGTHASVRGQRPKDLEEMGSQILLANTYHLLLRPGPDVFEQVGGIHSFMNWPRSVLTDSGGFQIFAMPGDRKMTEEGAIFSSYVDGKKILLSPEKSIATQKSIQSDIMMVLDQCVPSTVEYAVAKEAMELSCRWAKRSLDARGEAPSSLFAIVQGACFPELRKESAAHLSQMNFDGFALGGLAVGESKQEREDTVEFSAELLPKHLPRYLMGVGTPIDLLEAVHRGMDMFDCIIPSAHAEQGVAYTKKGKVLLRRGVYKFSKEPIDTSCACQACQQFSKAYLHHLIKTQEPLGRQMVTIHNIYFYHQLMSEMRMAILSDRFLSYYQSHRENLAAVDEEFPVSRPIKKERKEPLELGDFRIVISSEGYGSIQHKNSQEIMHSKTKPIEEAEKIYLSQSDILERLKKGEEIHVWDVGLGAAANTMALILRVEKELEGCSSTGKLTISSFESDLDSLRLALLHRDLFSYLKHNAPNAVLHKKIWQSKFAPIEWRLLEGDYFEQIENVNSPDIVFYDPFSSKTNPFFWTVEALTTLFKKLDEKKPFELFTYSASTAVRSSFLAAGFYLAKGVPVAGKEETTVVLNQQAIPKWKKGLLDKKWLERWKRSDAKLPYSNLSSNDNEAIIRKIERHPQFLP
ncbi:MAG: tRNA guanosine(34) transglycosylase Tgt [Oligoflexia bacterium]|nr:tRNA guanosine(34) transglycosylase Tgt [Oligoflexia bacterium]